MVFTQQQILNNKYQLQQRLGRTATGHQTWLATEINSDRAVAIKLLAFNPQMRWEELKLFEREAQILKTLDHPRIPKYYDYFDLDKDVGQGVPWFALVQQYIPGLSLQEALEKNRRFTEENILNITEQVLDILIYLHQLNPSILHRDIKPSNLILDESDRLYLIDFGAVQAQAAVTGVTFTVVGTVGYAPLEQFWGRAIEASDLYALGATIIHLLTGKSPADLPQKDSRLQFRNLVTIEHNFINWLEKVTELSLEKRFQSAVEAKEALVDNNYGYGDRENSLNAIYNYSEKTLVGYPISYSLVRIEKTKEQLKINIPAGGLARLDECLNAGFAGLIGYLFLFMMVAIFSIFIPGLFYILLILFFIKAATLIISKTEISINQYYGFVIKRKFLGIEYDKKKYSLKSIDNVFVQRTGSMFQVAVQANYRNFNLGGALDQNEAAWIVKEIKDYLNL